MAFESAASNLVGGDNNGFSDIFVRDRTTHKTSRASVSSAGVQGNSNSGSSAISSDGRFVTFESFSSTLVKADTNGVFDVFLRDRKLHKTYRVSVDSAGVQGDQESYQPAISANGAYVGFDSFATNLVAGDTNTFFDIFVRGSYR